MVEHSPEQDLRERGCVHRPTGRRGTSYTGEQFVAALYRLRGEAGLRMARKVQPFFWADAPLVTVWLCAECSTEAGLSVETQQLDAA